MLGKGLNLTTFRVCTNKSRPHFLNYKATFNTTLLLLHSCFHVLSYISIYVFSTLSFFLYYYNSYSPPSLSLTISTTLSFFYTESGTLFTVFGPRSMHICVQCVLQLYRTCFGLGFIQYNKKRMGFILFINIKTFIFS